MKNILRKKVCLISLVAVAVSFLMFGYASAKTKTIKVASVTANNSGNVVNINTALISELSKIPGIGKKKAANIVSYRENNNGFQNIREITKVKGIGKKLFKKIKGNITLGQIK